MMYHNQIDALMQATAPLFPRYEINAVDVNEGLDYGVANCAVRTYTIGSLIIDQLPSRFVEVRFGYTPDEHGMHDGKRIYGHTALGLWIAGEHGVVDSDTRSQIFFDQDTGDLEYEWFDLSAGYRQYLDDLDRRDVRFSRREVARVSKAVAGIT